MKLTRYSPFEEISGNGSLPIRFFLTPEMMPDQETLAQLKNLATAPGLQRYVTVLPDVHRKSRNLSPTGTVVAAKNALVPRAVDTGINCGMRMVLTDIDARELTPPILDDLFGKLKNSIPVFEHEQERFSPKDVVEILVRGCQWSQKEFGLSDHERNCIENRGTMPTDTNDDEAILACMPEKSTKKGARCLGTLGDGNHFLELQEIAEILNRDLANRLGLCEGKAFFMLHTGSRTVGSKMMKAYLRELEEKFLASRSKAAGPIWSVPADSEEGVKFARALAAASNFGFANRIVITDRLRRAVRQALHDESLEMPLLYDCGHVSIKAEMWQGERLWIHRHGASRALPPSQLQEHPVFSRTGQPVPIPGSMGHASYVGVAGEQAAEAFCSVNHGAGRVLDKPEALLRFTERQVQREMLDKNIRLYRYGSGEIAEQAPGSFKDISQVIEAMSAFSLALPVARLRPLAVLKG
ncbi:MAG: RtcB family protein [bacterium]